MITRRPEHVHQGGLWEFPGGKVETGERCRQALDRELHEEVGIEVFSARPLIRLHYEYPDKSVLLDVWRVDKFAGDAHGRENQPLQWVLPENLSDYKFPQANLPIISAVRLPEIYSITPEPDADEPAFLASLTLALRSGIRLVQLRAHSLPLAAYVRLADKVRQLCHQYGACLILNAAPDLVAEVGADGVHLNSQRLMALSERPLEKKYWVAASCHSLEELRQAEAIDVDFVVLGPVAKTASHPGNPVLGWKNFHALTDQASIPVYALGGMSRDDCGRAFEQGAQGIAAIRSLWVRAIDNQN